MHYCCSINARARAPALVRVPHLSHRCRHVWVSVCVCVCVYRLVECNTNEFCLTASRTAAFWFNMGSEHSDFGEHCEHHRPTWLHLIGSNYNFYCSFNWCNGSLSSLCPRSFYPQWALLAIDVCWNHLLLSTTTSTTDCDCTSAGGDEGAIMATSIKGAHTEKSML